MSYICHVARFFLFLLSFAGDVYFVFAPANEISMGQVLRTSRGEFADAHVVAKSRTGGDDLNFVRSLHRCNPTQTSGGKSKAFFYESHDKRFLLKARPFFLWTSP